MLQAGKLDRRITILVKGDARDSVGGLVGEWSEVATTWAQYLPGGGNERFSSGKVYAETQARFRIRWRTGITVKNRISYDGKTYDILAIDEIGRREGLELKVKARV